MSLFSKPEIQTLPQTALPSVTPPDPNQPDPIAARARQLDLAKRRQGQAATILTTPLGLTSNSATGSTLLGS